MSAHRAPSHERGYDPVSTTETEGPPARRRFDPGHREFGVVGSAQLERGGLGDEPSDPGDSHRVVKGAEVEYPPQHTVQQGPLVFRGLAWYRQSPKRAVLAFAIAGALLLVGVAAGIVANRKHEPIAYCNQYRCWTQSQMDVANENGPLLPSEMTPEQRAEFGIGDTGDATSGEMTPPSSTGVGSATSGEASVAPPSPTTVRPRTTPGSVPAPTAVPAPASIPTTLPLPTAAGTATGEMYHGWYRWGAAGESLTKPNYGLDITTTCEAPGSIWEMLEKHSSDRADVSSISSGERVCMVDPEVGEVVKAHTLTPSGYTDAEWCTATDGLGQNC